MRDSDTIAAIATAPGAAGIAIVRISGPDAIKIVGKIFTCGGTPPNLQSQRLLRHGFIRSPEGIVDEILLLIMRAPNSYTGEDVVELQGHGGSVPARRVLQVVLRSGARPAEPGEFTRRAFLNGRLDLVQAEAVLDLVHAQSDRAAAAALEQLTGKLSAPLETLRRQMLEVAADIEATLDFTEDETPMEIFPSVRQRLAAALETLDGLLATWEEGHLLREGVRAVISGRPNVGKSTLLNTLLGRDRAIVSDTPGTTRDLIEETWLLGDYPVRLVDTAGLRGAGCQVEQEGVRRARNLMRLADLHLYVIDASQPPHPDDAANLSEIPSDRCLILLNKSDLPVRITPDDFAGFTAIPTALIRGEGVNQLKSAMLDKLCRAEIATPPHAAISARHRAILESARADTQQALTILTEQREDLLAPAAAAVRAAAEQVGQMLGKTYYPELLDTIFSRFCVGK
ncbi:MAG: tRNA uridine-5-carboxymethylaminomethyl(34) synthesis GTPase MnmE [Kiritimatiellia bacterium]